MWRCLYELYKLNCRNANIKADSRNAPKRLRKTNNVEAEITEHTLRVHALITYP